MVRVKCGIPLPARAPRRAIQPGSFTTGGLVEVLGDLDVARYIAPPMAKTARVQNVGHVEKTSRLLTLSARRDTAVPQAFRAPLPVSHSI